MCVYVDDMYKYPAGRFKNMKMSHMVADTKSELLAMAEKIGLSPNWIQYPDSPRRCHFDVSLSKRKLAVEEGAIETTWREVALKCCDVDK